MDDLNFKEPTVSYYVHEGILARNERTIKRLIIALVIAFVLIFASNGLWLWAWSQYDYVSTDSTTTTTDSSFVNIDSKDGVANYIGNNGDITNGADNGIKNNNNKKTGSDKKTNAEE